MSLYETQEAISFIKKTFQKKLQKLSSVFEGLTTFEQCKLLLQLTRFMKANAESADLSLLGEGSRCGTLTMGKNITDINFAIIHQSPCGLIERIQKV